MIGAESQWAVTYATSLWSGVWCTVDESTVVVSRQVHEVLVLYCTVPISSGFTFVWYYEVARVLLFPSSLKRRLKNNAWMISHWYVNNRTAGLSPVKKGTNENIDLNLFRKGTVHTYTKYVSKKQLKYIYASQTLDTTMTFSLTWPSILIAGQNGEL